MVTVLSWLNVRMSHAAYAFAVIKHASASTVILMATLNDRAQVMGVSSMVVIRRVDMNKVYSNGSAGKRKSGRFQRGNAWLRRLERC